MRFPFRNFLAILKAWVKDIDWTPEDASMAKVITAGMGAAENFNRRQTIGFRNMIV
jgi:hypothetical protein